jgi:hypothetical protein
MDTELFTSPPEGYTACLADLLRTLYYDEKAGTLDVWAGRNFARINGIDPAVKEAKHFTRRSDKYTSRMTDLGGN